MDWIKYMETVQTEAREIWKDVFFASKYDVLRATIDEKSIDDAVKLANKATDAYLKKCNKLATGDWVSKTE